MKAVGIINLVVCVLCCMPVGTAWAKKPVIFETLIEKSVYQSAYERKIDAALLSMEVGKTTVSEVTQRLQNYTPIVDEGINPFTQGKMLTISGKKIDVHLMKEVTFIFNKQGIMSAALFTMEKGGIQGEDYFTGGFDAIYRKMASLYEAIGTLDLPSIGDKRARFVQDRVLIEMESPRTGDRFEIRFLTREFKLAFQAFMDEKQKPIVHAREDGERRFQPLAEDSLGLKE